MKNKASGSRTLLWSVIMSSPGPLVVGLGLLMGKSTTQIADFVRRTAELLAIILSFVVYRMTTKDGNTDITRKKKLEKKTNCFVGVAMCLGGSMMVLLSLLSSGQEKGNVIPGLCIALLGVVANFIFWRKYRRLGKAENNSILLVQGSLYRAKTFVDGCVSAALLSVVLLPNSPVSYYLDKIGSCVVAAYLILTGIRTIADGCAKENRDHE